MRPFSKSIAWRLQLWHAVILSIVVVGLSTGWFFQMRRAKLDEIDAELFGAARVLDGSLRGFDFADTLRANAEVSDDLTPNENRRLSLPRNVLEEADEMRTPYFAIWLSDGRLLKSERVPVGFGEFRESQSEAPLPQQQTKFREVRITGPAGSQVIVGRDVTREFEQLSRLTIQIIGFATGILFVGLLGGWWLARTVLKPIKDISRTASQFSASDMSPRINIGETESELGELATILNATFDRVQSAFDQQQQFAADASHELRTPLAVIQSQIELALRREREPEVYQAALRKCDSASERLSELVDSLLTLARLDSGEIQQEHSSIRLDHIAAKCIDMMRPVAEQANVLLEAEIEPVSVLGDPNQLQHAILNLLKNSITYNKEAGKVSVVVSSNGQNAELIIRDDGIGISDEDLSQVTKRFYRADKARSRNLGGCGLGLAIVDQIVTAHGGVMVISSKPDAGTVVAIQLKRILLQ